MPFEMNQKKKSLLKVVGAKLLEYGAIAALIWGYWLPKNREIMREEAQYQIELHNKINNKSTKGFRQIFSEETDIPIGRVGYVISDWYKDEEQFKKDVADIMPHIHDEVTTITPRLIIRDGKEWWLHTDGEEYRVKRDENGFGWFYSDPEWKSIYK